MLAARTRATACGARRLCLAGLPGARRQFWGVTVPEVASIGGPTSTKYRIVKPAKEGVHWDDYLIALPERDHLVKFSKEVPLFVRYLKLVTDKEGRQEDFAAFVERAKAGLEVETDVFITTEELLAVMWKNGYSETERNALQFTFPSDYKFHYPELSALFDIAEEDTYKFAMRTRMEASHIGELQLEKVQRKGFIRDHWLLFGTGIMIFKGFPFFNYYFGVKVFGTGLWCWTNWLLMNRAISKVSRRNEYMEAQKTAQNVMEGEDKIMESMSRFDNDSRCLDYLKDFQKETQSKMVDYRKALLVEQKSDLSERVLRQLQSIAQFEANMAASLQEVLVNETVGSFRDKFPKDAKMKQAAFDAAVSGLEGKASTAEDPVNAHFANAVKDLAGVDLLKSKADPNGSVTERVAFAQQSKEKEFTAAFMVTAGEAAEVKKLTAAAKKGADYDFSALSEADAAKLDGLFSSINGKVGYHLPSEGGLKQLPLVGDADADKYVEAVNMQIAAMSAQLKNQRLKAFATAFE